MSVWGRMTSGLRSKPKPVDLPRLGPGGPPAGIVTAMKGRRDTEAHPLIGADVGAIDAAMRAALDGRPQRLQDLYDDMVDRDDRVAAVKSTRILAVQSRPWACKPPRGMEQDPTAQRIARDVSLIISRIRSGEGGGWASCVGNIADAIMRGYSVNEIEWGVSIEGWHVPKALHWRHPRRFGFDRNTMECVRRDQSDGYDGVPLRSTWGADKFLIHQPIAGHAAYPTRRGAMMGMIFPALFKRYGWRWWIKATERWGQPITIAKLPQGQEQLKDAALDMMRRLKADFTGVMWGGMDLAAVPGTGNLNPAIFKDLIEQANLAIAIRGLGQNLTTEIQGGSYAAATVSNLVRMDLLTADLMELDASTARQLVEPIVRYNWPGEAVPEYVTEAAQREAISLDDVHDGVFTENDYRRAKGHAAKEEGGDDYRRPMSQVPVGIGPQEPALPAGAAPAADAQPSALNGAQVQALQGIVQAVAEGKLPRETGVAMIVAAFPISLAQAEQIMSTVGAGFEPEPDPADVAAIEAAGGADAASPLPRAQRSTRRPVPSSTPSTSQTSERSTTTRASELYRLLAESGPSPLRPSSRE